MNNFTCKDCGCDTREIFEYYMIRDDLWFIANKESRKGMLCIGCLEKRLGRELNSKDFICAPVNFTRWNKFSDRLLNRLSK